MKNLNAIKINEKLGYKIFDESWTLDLKLNKIKRITIKKDMIDDLIFKCDGHLFQTPRLKSLVKEILSNE